MSKTKDLARTPEEVINDMGRAVKAKAKAKEDKHLFDRVFSTGDGKRVLTDIMQRCCYQSHITTTTQTTGVDVHGMIHNAALHKHYLWLRQHISPEILRDIENPIE